MVSFLYSLQLEQARFVANFLYIQVITTYFEKMFYDTLDRFFLLDNQKYYSILIRTRYVLVRVY